MTTAKQRLIEQILNTRRTMGESVIPADRAELEALSPDALETEARILQQTVALQAATQAISSLRQVTGLMSRFPGNRSGRTG